METIETRKEKVQIKWREEGRDDSQDMKETKPPYFF